MEGFRKLIVYQKAKELVIVIYKLTEKWPKGEIYGLICQIRRASISVAANIAEGYTRSGTKEFSRFLDIALGSLVECEVFLEIAHELEYGQTADIETAKSLLIEIKKLLYSFKGGLNERVKENRVKE